MNNALTETELSFQFADVPGLPAATTSCTAFDVWARKSLGVVKGAGFIAKTIAGRDSVFLTLSNCK